VGDSWDSKIHKYKYQWILPSEINLVHQEFSWSFSPHQWWELGLEDDEEDERVEGGKGSHGCSNPRWTKRLPLFYSTGNSWAVLLLPKSDHIFWSNGPIFVIFELEIHGAIWTRVGKANVQFRDDPTVGSRDKSDLLPAVLKIIGDYSLQWTSSDLSSGILLYWWFIK